MRPLLAAVLAVLAVLALAVVGGCDAGTGGVEASGGSVSNGKQLFQDKCASCHVLADAGSRGVTGPNLDDAFAGVRQQGFAESTIREIVADQIKYAVPPMPQNLVTGDGVGDVAAYVASVAGTKGFSEPGEEAAGSGGADGKSVFTSAGCASCHTFSAAGSTGTVGPNLDEAKPPFELAIERITNGKGQMPPFRDTLSDAQIRAVAEFVASGGR